MSKYRYCGPHQPMVLAVVPVRQRLTTIVETRKNTNFLVHQPTGLAVVPAHQRLMWMNFKSLNHKQK
ncbi:MAG: hypothetical protein ABSC19_01970 [Syntrophorhabdales bacterium]